MNILVCFKAAPQVEMLIDEDWIVDEKLRVDTSFVKSALSTCDESALEIALRLLDGSGAPVESVTLSTLTVDDGSATAILKTLYALRFTKAVRIEPREDLHFKPLAISAIVSQYVLHHAPQDAVLFGGQSDIGQNSKTPMLVAEMLGWPCVSQAIQIERAGEGRLRVTSRTDDGNIRQRIRTPCVISVGDAPCTSLRVPTLRDRLQYGKKTVDVLSADEFRLPVETETPTDLEVLHHARAGVVIQGGGPAEKARVLYEEHLKPVLFRE
ncbi:MAG: electron transfer flavoprotein subunit beta/FixA family protein [Deltaproteobacteria bacterium]|jgi:electron transfer flavoprotein beta subunit|nr:electron transfer flavoprotein subunit beta/FixA family protein [Deltaproteobacteria bacterium]